MNRKIFTIYLLGIMLTVVSMACSQQPSTPTGLTVLPGDPITAVSCGNTLLAGYLQFNTSTGAPLHASVTKTFSSLATLDDTMGCVKVCLKGLIGDRTSDSVLVAVYADNAGEVGDLIAWHVESNYDWTALGTPSGSNPTYPSFILDHLEAGKTRAVIAGEYYWIAVQSDGYDNVLIERGNQNYCNTNKRGCETGGKLLIGGKPPAGSQYNIVYGPDCYGWSIW